jgi:hypothetical protein
MDITVAHHTTSHHITPDHQEEQQLRLLVNLRLLQLSMGHQVLIRPKTNG